jgi:glutamate/tyrosine decarboxylase-like PLP-dependent enzyme
MLGDWLTAAANFFCGVWLEASGPAQVETTVLGWFRDWLGLPPATMGVLTTGGSEANLLALVVARDRLRFEDRSKAVLYVGAQRHWSLDRAAKVIGLHPTQIRPVPLDGELRLRREALLDSIRSDQERGSVPWVVAANAGATGSGTVDALAEIADFCHSEGLWFHVDAAYGWVAALTSAGQRELTGINQADSITLDPHKWLAQSFDVGCLLVRDGRLLPETFGMRPDYLQDVLPGEGEVNYTDHGIALTRRFRALKIWLSVQVLGLDWFRQLADHSCKLAKYAQSVLESTGYFEILCPRRLSIVCFRYVDPNVDDLDQLNARLLDALKDTGRAFLSSTRLGGSFAIRMCFVNWRTTAADVDEIIDLLVRLGPEVVSGRVVPKETSLLAAGSKGNSPSA